MRQVVPETPPDYDRARIIERPNGFYWQSKEDEREYGPFATLLEAVQDMQASDDLASETAEAVAEAESELGIADWVDPDTGEPAEETVTRLEEH
jgi:hypothetical protein